MEMTPPNINKHLTPNWWKVVFITNLKDRFFNKHKKSSEQWKNPGWLGYIGGNITQVYRDYNKPL